MLNSILNNNLKPQAIKGFCVSNSLYSNSTKQQKHRKLSSFFLILIKILYILITSSGSQLYKGFNGIMVIGLLKITLIMR